VRHAEKRRAKHDAWAASRRARDEAAAERKGDYAERIIRCTDLDVAATLYDEIRGR
jgi:hypothetical protein